MLCLVDSCFFSMVLLLCCRHTAHGSNSCAPASCILSATCSSPLQHCTLTSACAHVLFSARIPLSPTSVLPQSRPVPRTLQTLHTLHTHPSHLVPSLAPRLRSSIVSRLFNAAIRHPDSFSSPSHPAQNGAASPRVLISSQFQATWSPIIRFHSVNEASNRRAFSSSHFSIPLFFLSHRFAARSCPSYQGTIRIVRVFPSAHHAFKTLPHPRPRCPIQSVAPRRPIDHTSAIFEMNALLLRCEFSRTLSASQLQIIPSSS
jgi:hypothetical protein